MGAFMGFVIFFFCLFPNPPAYGQTTEAKLSWLESLPASEREARLIESARKEGEVIAYANLNVAAASVLTDGFMKKYPFIKARIVRLSGTAIINRVEAEARAGKVSSDVIMSGQLGILAFEEKKVFARYLSPLRVLYPQGFKDKEGYWTVFFTNLMVSSYNTRRVKEEEAPRRLEDLLRPRWKGKMAMDTESYVWFGAVLQYLGEEAGLRFMRKLNEQDLSHVRGRRHMNQLVAAGEHDLAVETNLNSVLSLTKEGAPLWFAPIQPLFLAPSMLFLNQNAPHSHAGALLIDYLLSEEGQRMIASTDRTPAHRKARSAESRFLEGLEIRMPEVVDIGKRYNAIAKQYREIFPGAS